MEENRTYRVRTKVGADAPDVINVKLEQTYDMLEILSLKISQTHAYKLFQSNYGIITGRVLANGGFGIPNAKVSVFIPTEEDAGDINRYNLYPFNTTSDKSNDGIRYNLLPKDQVNDCHQNVGIFPSKRYLLDNDIILEIFDKYWKYTTSTNDSGDYMLTGIPTGMQEVHVDIDLSDIGILSQRPRDMMYKGFNTTQFESPNRFKKSKDLGSLVQIYTQNKGVYVYPFWGDTSDESNNATVAITRCDIDIDYKFEPTCVFLGSAITDKGSNAINENCLPRNESGLLPEMIATKGTIEMIRKTIYGNTEEFAIQGNDLIDGDGTWCYQIPMNLDYVTTDEFGNTVATDDPTKGIPTRTRVRFRVSLTESPEDAQATKRCKYLVPNNPRISKDYPEFSVTHKPDYEFGTNTTDENYRDLFMNNVYTVKSYIPRLQKGTRQGARKHTGIKRVNRAGDNNPFPYNNILIGLSFQYRMICVITKVIIYLVVVLNTILGALLEPFCEMCRLFRTLGKIPILGYVFKLLASFFCAIVFECIKMSSEFCDDGVNKKTYFPGCWGCQWSETKRRFLNKVDSSDLDGMTMPDNTPNLSHWSDSTLLTCIENSLAQDNNATDFNFVNDWINGCLYFPLWYRRIRPKQKAFFGLISVKAKDEWCSAHNPNKNVQLHQSCALPRTVVGNMSDNSPNHNQRSFSIKTKIPSGEKKEHYQNCNEKWKQMTINGIVETTENMWGQTLYYYKAAEFNTRLATNTAFDKSLYAISVVKDKEEDNGLNGSTGEGEISQDRDENPPSYTGPSTSTIMYRYGEVYLLFATDIVLLGSLNDVDKQGIPQFFKRLEPSTYKLPSDVLTTDTEFTIFSKSEDDEEDLDIDVDYFSQMAGSDWGNYNKDDQCDKTDGGLFYGIGCSQIDIFPKSCVNLSRICEFGVTLDQSQDILLRSQRDLLNTNNAADAYKRLITDGFISADEITDIDGRSMFATLNHNNLRTKINDVNGFRQYVFKPMYLDNFDGALIDVMKKKQNSCPQNITYKHNYKLEENVCQDYYRFRMGAEPYFYNSSEELSNGNGDFPRYENSLYFYFGLKNGKTAIEKFNHQFYSECTEPELEAFTFRVRTNSRGYCVETDDTKDGDDDLITNDQGIIVIDLTGIAAPFDITIIDANGATYTATSITDTKIYIGDKSIRPLDQDYKRIDTLFTNVLTENSIGIGIYNGSYDVYVTDANGNTLKQSVVVGNKKLSYQTTVDEFALTYDALIELCNSGKGLTATNAEECYDNIIKQTAKNSNLGGKIILSPITMDNEALNQVKLSIKLLHDFNNTETYDWSAEATCKMTEITQNEFYGWANISTSTNNVFKINNSSIEISIPLPNASYQLIVTQLCGEEETQNSTITTVFTKNPIPFKLYINDVDYELIRNFKVGGGDNGWVKLGNDGNNAPELFGWDKVSECDDIEMIEDTDTFYKIDSYPDNQQLVVTTMVEATESMDDMPVVSINDERHVDIITYTNNGNKSVKEIINDYSIIDFQGYENHTFQGRLDLMNQNIILDMLTSINTVANVTYETINNTPVAIYFIQVTDKEILSKTDTYYAGIIEYQTNKLVIRVVFNNNIDDDTNYGKIMTDLKDADNQPLNQIFIYQDSYSGRESSRRLDESFDTSILNYQIENDKKISFSVSNIDIVSVSLNQYDKMTINKNTVNYEIIQNITDVSKLSYQINKYEINTESTSVSAISIEYKDADNNTKTETQSIKIDDNVDSIQETIDNIPDTNIRTIRYTVDKTLSPMQMMTGAKPYIDYNFMGIKQYDNVFNYYAYYYTKFIDLGDEKLQKMINNILTVLCYS